MMRAIWLILPMLSALVGAQRPQFSGPDPTVITVTVPVSISVDHADVREALKQLFRQYRSQYSIAPEVQGTVTVDIKHVEFETALRCVLNQVGGNFRMETGIYVCYKIGNPSSGWSPMMMLPAFPDFRPGRFSASLDIKNVDLFKTPRRTVGGTYDLLVEAAEAAGFSDWTAYRYGKSGFALALPIEAIDENGKPKEGASRFQPCLNTFGPDYGRIAEIWAQAGGNPEWSYRALVLVVGADEVRPEGSPRIERMDPPAGGVGLPDDLRKRVWGETPKLTVLVYEFRNGSRLLLNPGDSKIGAKSHVILSGLWTEKELG